MFLHLAVRSHDFISLQFGALVSDPGGVEAIGGIEGLSGVAVVRVGDDVVVPLFSVEVAIHQLFGVLNYLFLRLVHQQGMVQRLDYIEHLVGVEDALVDNFEGLGIVEWVLGVLDVLAGKPFFLNVNLILRLKLKVQVVILDMWISPSY